MAFHRYMHIERIDGHHTIETLEKMRKPHKTRKKMGQIKTLCQVLRSILEQKQKYPELF
jgi:hypothetical protein